MIEGRHNATALDDAAALVGAEFARVIHRGRPEIWVRLSAFSHDPTSLVATLLGTIGNQVGATFSLEEIAAARDQVGFVRDRVERLVARFEAEAEKVS